MKHLAQIILAGGAIVLAVFAQQPSKAVFSFGQASSGAALYAQMCAGCHGADLDGSGDAPALTGGTFMLNWRSKMVSELFGQIMQTMPPSNAGSLSEEAALNATAF